MAPLSASILSAFLLFGTAGWAAPGESPESAILARAGTTTFDSTEVPLLSPGTPQSCNTVSQQLNGPFYHATWFRFHAGEAIKVIDLRVDTQETRDTVLAAFRQELDGTLKRIACNLSQLSFSNIGTSKYLFVVAEMVAPGGPAKLIVETSETGVLIAPGSGRGR